MTSLVYVHIGNNIPKYLYDSLYQVLLINGYKSKINVILADDLIDEFWGNVSSYNLNIYYKEPFYYSNIINTIPLSILDNYLKDDILYNKYKDLMELRYKGIDNFREGFWISTTSRFFYINAFMNVYNLYNVFHIENDIVMYESFDNIYNSMKTSEECNKIWVVRDAPHRVVPSLMFFPSTSCINELVTSMVENIEGSSTFINDMDNIGRYKNCINLPIFPLMNENHNILFDGAAIGQYIGGVDVRNAPHNDEDRELLEFRGVNLGFINETSVFKPDRCIFSKCNVKMNEHTIPLRNVFCVEPNIKKLTTIANVHIHSKQLYKFSSIFDIHYDDIITGDRVLKLCDFVLATRDIYNFHRGIENYANDIIILNDLKKIDMEKLNKYFIEFTKKTNQNTIKLFVYTHILEAFTHLILDKLDKSIDYVIYAHNSDHPLDDTYKILLEKEYIKHIYAQNIDYSYKTNKLTLLPIGMANSMWIHGDTVEMYRTMINSYMLEKTNSIYVNINPNTYGYRKEILDTIEKTKCWKLSKSKPYGEYLRELSSYRFCLCIRGNGLDTHRFWESLYLGVIPVILNNNETKCTTFIKYLKELDVPFVVIEEDDIEKMCEKYNEEYFNENRYKEIIKKRGCSIYNTESLKISRYSYNEN